jgi:hypothetical protein
MGQKMLRSLRLRQILEMRLAIVAGIDSAKFHEVSKIGLGYRLTVIDRVFQLVVWIGTIKPGGDTRLGPATQIPLVSENANLRCRSRLIQAALEDRGSN